MNTYLGQKGYTIFKDEVTAEQIKQIKSDLTIRPFTQGAPPSVVLTFPAYRESLNKIYVPHYYGTEKFGLPKTYKITEGSDIALTFDGVLRDKQILVVDTYLKHIDTVKIGGGLLELPCAFGKTVLALNIIAKLKKKTIIMPD
jgi:hypothetical protein